MKAFSITSDPATTILTELHGKFNSSLEKLDVVLAEYELGGAVVLHGLVVGFQKGKHQPAVTFSEEFGYLVVSNTPEGEELLFKLPKIEPTPQTITEAFGGKPFEKDGKLHFMSIRFLGGPVLLVPSEMEASLPDGLQPISYVTV